MNRPTFTTPKRLPLMLLAMASLLAALWSGLLRMGWAWPLLQPTLPMAHGPLMVSGFLGTLISLERAVALDRRWAYAAPLCTGLGGALLLLGQGGVTGPLLTTAGSVGLVVIFGVLLRMQNERFAQVMALGALAWLVGNLAWLGGAPVFAVVPWWMAFLVLTIAGERLELSRMLMHARRVQQQFLGLTGLLVAGLVVLVLWPAIGARIAGVALVGLAAWLSRYDVARRTIRQQGLTRYIAVCLLSGYLWLGIGGALALAYGPVIAGPAYDAILHAVFVGFVFAMIFGHAPIIFPSVLGLPIHYRPLFYGPLALLHLSLAVRLIGDSAGWIALRRWGGLINAAAILFFLASMIYSMIRRPASRDLRHR
jgi:hypothetical protein